MALKVLLHLVKKGNPTLMNKKSTTVHSKKIAYVDEGKGQPILETPEDGKEFFNNVPVDMAVIHGEILER